MSLFISVDALFAGTSNPDFLFSLGAAAEVDGGDGADLIFGDLSIVVLAGNGTSLANAKNLDAAENWIVAENPLLADDTVPSTMVLVEATAGRQYFYSVTVAAGETITVDVDSWGSSFQTSTRPRITIYNPAQTPVASGSPTTTADEGLGSHPLLAADSFATHVAATSGTYFIHIDETLSSTDNDVNFDGGEQFIVNVSVTGHAATATPLVDNDILNGGAGDDLLAGLGGNDILGGGDGSDQMDGGSGNDTLFGGIGRDRLFGGTGNDTLDGGDDNDFLHGGEGADQLFGGAGNDTFVGGNGDLFFDGGDGVDLLDLSGLDNFVSVDLLGGSAITQPFQVAFLSGIENLTGTAFADRLAGNDLDNVLIGGAGSDTLEGRGGIDTVSYATSDAGVTLFLTSGNGFGGHAQGDRLTDIENVTGSQFNDLLFGSEQANVIDAGTGSDTVYGGGGDDRILVDGHGNVIYGGAGNDTINYLNDTTPSSQFSEFAGEEGDDQIILSSLISGAPLHLDGGSGTDTLDILFGTLSLDMNNGETNLANVRATNFENVDCPRGNDTVIGTAAANAIRGSFGNDSLLGGLGNDSLNGDDGNDFLQGDEGDDAISGGFGNDVIQGNEGADNLRGDFGNDTLSGGNGNDTLDGSFGNDSIQGNDGDDRIFDSFGDNTISGGLGSDLIFAADGADSISGGNLGDTIFGGFGADTISGGLGLDQLDGGASDDLIFGDAGSDSITGGSGNDTLDGGNQFDTLNGGDGDDVIAGGLLRDVSTGGAGADTFRYNVNDFGTGLRAGADRITDFSQAQGDRIDLSLIDASTTAAGNNAFSFIGTAAFVSDGVGGRLRFVQAGGNTFVEGDRNGDGVADFAIQLDGLILLGSADFVL